MPTSRTFGRFALMTALALSGARPLAAQFATPTSKKLCALLQPADLTVLLKTPTPAPGQEFGNQCRWSSTSNVNGKVSTITFAIRLAPPSSGETSEQAFTRQRTGHMRDARVIHTRDESGMGDQAYSWYQDPIQAYFFVLTKGQLLTFWVTGSGDVDALRPVVKKALAAYTP
jgi:hypothetical protein